MPDGRSPLPDPLGNGDDRHSPFQQFSVNDNAGVYYGDDYWNNLPEVAAWLNAKVSGDPERYWGEHFGQTAGAPSSGRWCSTVATATSSRASSAMA